MSESQPAGAAAGHEEPGSKGVTGGGRPAPEPQRGPAGTSLPRFARDSDYRVLGGVAAGLAGALGIDVALVRAAFVVAALLHGAGAIAYLAGWVALPSLDSLRAGRGPRWPAIRMVVGAALAAVSLLVLVAPFDLFSTGITVPVLLIGFALALWGSGPRRRPGIPLPRWQRAGGEGSPQDSRPAPDGPSAELATPSPPSGPAVPVPEPETASLSSRVGRLTIGATVLAVGLALLLDRARVLAGFTAARALSLALVVLGMGLSLGAITGRGRWLALLALALVPAAAAATTIERMGLDPFAPNDAAEYAAGSAEQVQPLYRRGTGDLTVYLGAVNLGGGSKTVAVETAAGNLTVWVPETALVDVDAETGLGRLVLPGEPDHVGLGQARAVRLPGQAAAGRLQLELRTGIGTITVLRGTPQNAVPASGKSG